MPRLANSRPFLLAAALWVGAGASEAQAQQERPRGSFEGALAGAPVAVKGRPFGLALGASNEVFVTRQDDDLVSRFQWPAIATADSGAMRELPTGSLPADVVLTSRGDQAIVSSFSAGSVHFLDLASGTETGRVQLGANAYRMALSADDATLWVTTTGGRVFAIDRAERRVTYVTQLNGPLHGIDYDARTGRIAVSSTQGHVWLLDGVTLRLLDSTNVGGHAQEVMFSPNGRELLVAQENAGRVTVLDAATLDERARIRFYMDDNIRPFSLAVSPDGRVLLVGSATTGRIAVVDLRSRETFRVIPVGGATRRMVFSRDGKLAFAAHEGGEVLILR